MRENSSYLKEKFSKSRKGHFFQFDINIFLHDIYALYATKPLETYKCVETA